jgi:hypothetical protein
VLSLLAAGSFAAVADELLPRSPSCDYVKEVAVYSLSNCTMNPQEVPVLVSKNQCLVRGLTTVLELPNQVRQDLLPLITAPLDQIEHNFTEMMTPAIYQTQAEIGADKVERISSTVYGDLRLTIDGVVAANGDVPVRIDNFSIEVIGKMKQSVASLYLKMRLDQVEIQGVYNIFNGQLTAVQDASRAQPQVSMDVNIPFIFKLFQKLQPKILQKIQAEVERLANRIARIAGIQLTDAPPAAIAYHARINPSVLLPIKALQNQPVGSYVKYQISGNRYAVTVKDDSQQISSTLAPICPSMSFPLRPAG